MSRANIDTGRAGEERAVAYLKKNGYCLLARNLRSRFGEIDIVAKDKDVVCFVEVRTRRGPAGHEEALSSVDSRKQFRLSRLAVGFLKEKKLLECRARFDVVCVALEEDKEDILLLKNAFEICQRYA